MSVSPKHTQRQRWPMTNTDCGLTEPDWHLKVAAEEAFRSIYANKRGDRRVPPSDGL